MRKPTIHDQEEDLQIIRELISSNIHRIQNHLKRVKFLSRSIPKSSVAIALEHGDKLIIDYTNLLVHISDRGVPQLYDALRSLQGIMGAFLVSTDWQSPSFSSSGISEAGSQTGKIYATMNDYKRDQHWQAYDYEQAFLKKYIDGVFKLPVNIYATNSGMAAFATILNYLRMEKKTPGPVLIGQSIYFENKELLLKAYPGNLIEVDESNTKQILTAIRTKRPSAIFLDSLTNAPRIIKPDLHAIVPFVVKYAKVETYIVIDNTGLSVSFQPLKYFLGRWTKARLIVFESLNKYHQFGLDRVTGGILWGYGGDTGKLFDYRDHLGTIITDAAAASLPFPNRSILTKRLIRHTRNASVIVVHLQSWITNHPSAPFAAIQYAGGSYFVITMKPRFAIASFYKRLMREMIKEAKKQHINLAGGTSFGLSTTRVYAPAIRDHNGTPFFRVAVGTEHLEVIEVMSDVFTRVFEKLS